MYQPNALDRTSLQTQLTNYDLIAAVNSELMDENPSTKEKLAKKIELAQSCINESNQWEELGDQTKSHDALSNANMIIIEIKTVIKHVLYQDTFLDDSDLLLGQSPA